MKKIIALAFTATLFIAVISSCSKKETTLEKDYTTSVVGNYNGSYTDTTIGTSDNNITETNQTLSVTKIDNTHIKVTPSNTLDRYTFTAELSETTVGDLLLSIPYQTSNGEAIYGLPLVYGTVTTNGAYSVTSKKLYFITTNSEDLQGFNGTKQ